MSAGLTTYYLEMLNRDAILQEESPTGFSVLMVKPPDPKINERFYKEVGRKWGWTDRLVWSDEEWLQHSHDPSLETWLGYMNGETAGFFELQSQDGGNVEIVYFGLLPMFIGKGLGRPLLSAAVEQAWSYPQTTRVWVHTCTEDHPNALDNYHKHGFKLYKTEKT